MNTTTIYHHHNRRRLRVVSLLPSATDMLCFVADPTWLVGRSHECDYPPAVQTLPILTAARVRFESSRQMHESVNNSLSQGKGLYTYAPAHRCSCTDSHTCCTPPGWTQSSCRPWHPMLY